MRGAGYGERTPERTNYRNGYRDRLWQTHAGSVELQLPKLRKGAYFPGFLEPRRTAERALAAVIREAYVQGVSTRGVDELVKAMGNDRHQQVPGVPVVRDDRRAGQRLPGTAHRGRLAVPVDRRDLCEGA